MASPVSRRICLLPLAIAALAPSTSISPMEASNAALPWPMASFPSLSRSIRCDSGSFTVDEAGIALAMLVKARLACRSPPLALTSASTIWSTVASAASTSS